MSNGPKRHLEQSEEEQEIIERGFSPAFNRLVRDRTDFVGIVAYGMYKTQKQQYVAENGLSRATQDVENYFKFLTDEQVRTLRDDAQTRLNTYFATLFEEARNAIEQEAKESAISKEVRALRSWGAFIRGASESVVGSLIVALIAAALLVAAWQLPIRHTVIDIRTC